MATNLIAVVCLAVWFAAVAIHLLGLAFSVKKNRERTPRPDIDLAAQPVSVLKPIAGLEDHLEENLRSFFAQDYPRFEIMICCADARDPALAIVTQLMAEFPSVPVRVAISTPRHGENPKVANLEPGYDAARFDIVLISDSNVIAEPDSLARLVRHLEPGVGLVCGVTAGVSPDGVGAHLDALALNTFYTRGMHLALFAGRTATPGKAMLFEKRVLESAGGLHSLGRFLAEDYMLGRRIADTGARIAVLNAPVRQYIGTSRMRDYWRRHARWASMRRTLDPRAFALEPLVTNALLTGALAAWSLHQLFGLAPAPILALHIGAWIASDAFLHRRMGGPLDAWFGVYWLLREVTALGIWCSAWARRDVVWRGRTMRFSREGVLQ